MLTLFDDIRGYMGDRRAWVLLAAIALAVTACSDTTDPTLAPGTTASPTTTSTTTEAPTTTTVEAPTTTVEATTTTEDPDARRAEIEALAKDVEVGRLNAIYNESREALLQWLGSQAAYDDALAVIDEERLSFLQEPTHENVAFGVDEVLLDREDCVAIAATIDTTGVVEGAEGTSSLILIYWPTADDRLQRGAVWQAGTPQFQWMEECDIALRGVTP